LVSYACSLYASLPKDVSAFAQYAQLAKSKDVDVQRFVKSYPVVCKHMCTGEFSEAAFRHIIKLQQEKNIENAKCQNKDVVREQNDFITTQAEYARQLAMEKRMSKKKVASVYQTTLDELRDTLKQAEDEVRYYDEHMLNVHKREFCEYLRKHLFYASQ